VLQTVGSGSYPFPCPPFHLANQKMDLLSFDAFAKTPFESVLTWAGQLELPPDVEVMMMRGCLPQAAGGGKNVGIQGVAPVAVRVLQNNHLKECSRVGEVVKSSILWTARY
jgi:hypothetical protein